MKNVSVSEIIKQVEIRNITFSITFLACECNLEGSRTMQCAREDGACHCLKGIGGHKCDECARGYLGQAPYCSPCGECFDNWDRIINEKKEETLELIERAKNMKKIGAVGGYIREFEDMEKQLVDVQDLINNTTISNEDVVNIEITQGLLNTKLQKNMENLNHVENNIMANVTQDINLKQIALNDLQMREQNLKSITLEMKNNSTILQEANVRGALSLIHVAKQNAIAAEKRVNDAKVYFNFFFWNLRLSKIGLQLIFNKYSGYIGAEA